MVLLMAMATNHHVAALAAGGRGSVGAAAVQGAVGAPSGCLPSQRRLAEITEMIHTASLFHDDVIDNAVRSLGILEYEYADNVDELLACAPEETTVTVAADTSAVDNVIPITAIPEDACPMASWSDTSSVRTTHASISSALATQG